MKQYNKIKKTGKNRFLRAQKGFTLIEILVAAAIFAMVVTVSMVTFGANSALQSRSDAVRAASENAKFIVEAIARDIRLADDASVSTSNNTITARQGNDIIIYSYSSPNIRYTEKISGVTTINNVPLNSSNISVDSLSFSNVAPAGSTTPLIKISMKFTAKIGSKAVETQSETIETTVSTRNYPSFYKNYTQ